MWFRGAGRSASGLRTWGRAGRNRTTPFVKCRLPPLRAELPVIKGAEYVDADEECANCHESLVETFKQNVHHGIRKGESCEACHGPCSEHVDSAGEKPGLVWSFKSLSAAQRSEICARCHEDDACGAGAQWRTSVHAHRGLSCLDCHTAHYERQDKKSKQADKSEEKPAADSPQGVPAKLVSDEKPRESKSDAPAVPSNNLGAIVARRLLPLPRRHGRFAAHCRAAPDLRPQRVQLHHLPRCPRKDRRSVAGGNVPDLPSGPLADDGLAFLDARHRRGGLYRLP